jgi:hypothetical protein
MFSYLKEMKEYHLRKKFVRTEFLIGRENSFRGLIIGLGLTEQYFIKFDQYKFIQNYQYLIKIVTGIKLKK